MANSLLGLDPENEDAMFPVCMDMDSCTKETTYATGKWLGYGERFIVSNFSLIQRITPLLLKTAPACLNFELLVTNVFRSNS